eukprot:INCI1560.3.p1 GENE.INCI1560.3~~INCI1560.3.p1  ORF type:complete len:621 (-),score=103.38 INCI1560.3:147-2009(-)
MSYNLGPPHDGPHDRAVDSFLFGDDQLFDEGHGPDFSESSIHPEVAAATGAAAIGRESYDATSVAGGGPSFDDDPFAISGVKCGPASKRRRAPLPRPDLAQSHEGARPHHLPPNLEIEGLPTSLSDAGAFLGGTRMPSPVDVDFGSSAATVGARTHLAPPATQDTMELQRLQQQQQLLQQQQKQRKQLQLQQGMNPPSPKLKRKTRTPKNATTSTKGEKTKKDQPASSKRSDSVKVSARSGTKATKARRGSGSGGTGATRGGGSSSGGGSGGNGRSKSREKGRASNDQKDRRIKHNAAERTRTRTISQKIKRLHELLEQEGQPVKNEKLHIITEALHYIKVLTATVQTAKRSAGEACFEVTDNVHVKDERTACERNDHEQAMATRVKQENNSSVSPSNVHDVARAAVAQDLAPYVVLGLDLRILYCSPQFSAGLLHLTKRPRLNFGSILTLMYGASSTPPTGSKSNGFGGGPSAESHRLWKQLVDLAEERIGRATAGNGGRESTSSAADSASSAAGPARPSSSTSRACEGSIAQVIDCFVVPDTQTKHWFRLDVSVVPLLPAMPSAGATAGSGSGSGRKDHAGKTARIGLMAALLPLSHFPARDVKPQLRVLRHELAVPV